MTKSTFLALASAALAIAGAVTAPMAHAGGDARQWLNDMTYPSQAATPSYGTPKTRAQVQAELAEAKRTGAITFGEAGARLSDMYPGAYANATATAATPPVTRAQVKAELAEAVRTGDVMVGESNKKLNELYPQRYQHATVKSSTQTH